MSSLKSISLIIPTYNDVVYLEHCLRSIKQQKLKPLEVIVVDNNSTDNTKHVVEKYDFVTYTQELKQGVVYARDKGFTMARGDIIARIDADTILPPDWLEKVQQFYVSDAHGNYAITGGGIFYNLRLQHFNGWIQSQIAFRFNRFIIGHYILWGSNMAMPRYMWDNVKKNVCLRDDIHEDIDLAIHLHELGYLIRYDESLRVSVKLKRIWSDREQQRIHRARWPRTLHIHGYKLWWMGTVGNAFLVAIIQPYLLFIDFVARIFKRPDLLR